MEPYSQCPWTEAQWTQVQETVRDEAKKQRVAAAFLPVHGPLASDDQTVSLQFLNFASRPTPPWIPPPPPTWTGEVNDFDTRRLTTLSVHVRLRGAQVAEPDLSAALVAFRRAANLIARTEDRLIFRGQWGPAAPPNFRGLEPCAITGGAAFDGLLDTALNLPQIVTVQPGPFNPSGNGLVRAVEGGIGLLEQQGHLGPFALVLGTRLFGVAHSPNAALVLPADRIKPMIDGPLLRSNTLNRLGIVINPGPPVVATVQPRASGLLVSLADDLIDLVVGSEIGVQLLQVTEADSPRYVFRVSERFALRIKQPRALAALA